MIPIGLDFDKIKITFLMDLLNGNIDGSQSKWFVNDHYYKMDDIGYEGLSETLASEILKKSNINNFVEYKPIVINYKNKEKQGCYSYNFIDNNKFLLPITHLFKKENEFGVLEQPYINHKYQIITFIDIVKNITNLQDFDKYLTSMFEFDSLIKNTDRHLSNIAVLYDKKTKEYDYCPIFDNGRSFGTAIQHASNLKEFMELSASPFTKTFEEQTKICEDITGQQFVTTFSMNDLAKTLEFCSRFYDNITLSKVELFFTHQFMNNLRFFNNLDKEKILNKEINKLENLIKFNSYKITQDHLEFHLENNYKINFYFDNKTFLYFHNEKNLTVEDIILNENHNLFKINFYDKIKDIYNEKQKGDDYEL